MRPCFGFLLRWARHAAFVTLLVIVVIGLVSCAGGSNRSSGTGLTNAALNASSSPTPTGGATGGTTGGSGSGTSGGSGSGGSGSGSGGTGGSGSGGTGGSGGGTGGSGGGTGSSGGGTAGSLPPTADPSGTVQTFTTDPSGQIDTTAAFFQSLGTNGRSCSTCHVQGDGWSISAADVQARFTRAQANAGGLTSDPIFQADGATCDHGVDLSTPTAQAQAFKLLTSRGLIRIALAVPTGTGTEFTVDSVSTPYACNETSVLSMYRRPLPTANLRFLTMVMWDGRESSALTGTKDITRNATPADLLANLAHQAVDATLIHAQGSVATPLTTAQQQAIVNAEMAVFVAQSSDSTAGSLQADGTTGGPAPLATQTFSIGLNDPFSPPGFNFSVFTLFNNWSNSTTAQKASIARGQTIFSTRSFLISGVAGFNDTFFGGGPAAEPCGYCHDSPNVGNHSLAVPMNIGVTNVTNPQTNPLDTSYLPVFTLRNITANPPTPATAQTTDPGVALVTGKWADIGKVKVPILRGLASRAPYFHNGAALTLSDVVNFYDQRFGIGFTPQDKADLVAFLSTL